SSPTCLDSLHISRHRSENAIFSDPCPPLPATLAPVTSLASFSALDDDPGVQERSLAEFSQAAERVQDYAGRSKSSATIKAYASGWRDFLDFCGQRQLSALPASDETVAQYLSSM